jgi:hypothetical protein
VPATMNGRLAAAPTVARAYCFTGETLAMAFQDRNWTANDTRNVTKPMANTSAPNSLTGWLGTSPIPRQNEGGHQGDKAFGGALRQLGKGENPREVDRYGDDQESGQRRRRPDFGNEEICPVASWWIHLRLQRFRFPNQQGKPALSSFRSSRRVVDGVRCRGVQADPRC